MIRLKSSPSANSETTYLILVLVEDERRLLPVELDSMMRCWQEEEGMIQDIRE